MQLDITLFTLALIFALFGVLAFGAVAAMMLLLRRVIKKVIDGSLRESEDLLDFRLSALEDLHITDAELSQFISYESRITALEADTVETTAILGNIITRIDGLAEWHSRCEPVKESTVKFTAAPKSHLDM